jgi:hypothetical protein
MLERINELLARPSVTVILRTAMLAAFVAIAAVGFSAYADDPALLRELRNTNPGNLVVWAYWWPLIVAVTLIAGRVWCLVCPVELLVSLLSKISLKRKRPRWLLSGWGITMLYAAVLFIGIEGLRVHRNPAMMASYLVVIVLAAAAVSLVFEKNTFCRALCPVGHLLGLYARFSPWGWRVKDPRVCGACKDRSCVAKTHLYHVSTKSCGVGLDPASLDDNTRCILCTGCLKACARLGPRGAAGRPNPGLRRIGFAADHFKLRPLTGAEAFFLLVLTGFVMQEVLPAWGPMEKALRCLPDLFRRLLPPAGPVTAGLETSLALYLVVPAALWAVPYLASLLAGSGLSPGDYVRRYGLAFLPVTAAAHAAQSLAKMTDRCRYLEHLSSDLSGMSAARGILEGRLSLDPLPAWAEGFVTVEFTFLVLAGIYLGVKTVGALNARLGTRGAGAAALHLIPLLYGALFVAMLAGARWAGA